MKTIKTILLIIISLIAITSFSQQNKEDVRECKRIASHKFKSVTQTDYNYVYDFNTRSKKPSTKGLKEFTRSYDTKGNLIQEIDYNQFGNIDSKTNQKYDNRGNSTEVAVYGSDGILQSKTVMTYNKDTMTTIKGFNPDGTLYYANFAVMKSSIEKENRVCMLTAYSSKDSTLIVGSMKSTYNSKGDLIEYAEYEGKYLKYREEYEYNEKGWKIKSTRYKSINNNDFVALQTFKYDVAGNLIEMMTDNPNSSSYNIYKYDAKGNLIEATKYSGDKTPMTLYKYSYVFYQ